MKILTHPNSSHVLEVDDHRAGLYLAQGWRVATPKAPRASASKAEWVEFAIAQGLDPAEAEAMKRDELRAALS